LFSPPEYSDFFVFLDILIGEGAFKYKWDVKDWGRLLRVAKPVFGMRSSTLLCNIEIEIYY